MITQDNIRDKLQSEFPEAFEFTIAKDGMLTATLDKASVLAAANFMKADKELKFTQLTDISGVDYLTYGLSEWDTTLATGNGFGRGVDSLVPVSDKERRFAVVYHLLSIVNNIRIRIKVFLATDFPRVASVTSVWQAANWYEREAFDLFGIYFDNHPDLRRLLTDYGFIGHPFRKDFPISGQVEMRYDAASGRVVYEPVSIEPRTLVPKTIRDDSRYAES